MNSQIIPISRELLENPKFKNLPGNAVKIYLYMLKRAQENDFKPFNFSKADYKPFFCYQTFENNVACLVEDGFLKVSENVILGYEKIYKISDKWKEKR